MNEVKHFESVFVIFEGGTRQFDNASVQLFDGILSVNEKNGVKASFNFNNIIGVTGYGEETE